MRLTTTAPRLHVGVGRSINRRGLTAGFLSLFKRDVIVKQGLVLLALGIVLGIWPQISQAGFVTFVATLTGVETPGGGNSNVILVGSGTGFAQVDFDIVARQMRVQAIFAGLSGNTTVAHIHGPTAAPGVGTAGVMTTTPSFPGFPTGVTFGTYDQLFDTSLASTYRAAFVTASGGVAGAEATLYASLLAGTAYLNVHSTTFPSGEISGFLNAVPEPASLTSLAIGAVGLLLARRRFVKRK